MSSSRMEITKWVVECVAFLELPGNLPFPEWQRDVSVIMQFPWLRKATLGGFAPPFQIG